jgi:CHAT domain-containing protein
MKTCCRYPVFQVTLIALILAGFPCVSCGQINTSRNIQSPIMQPLAQPTAGSPERRAVIEREQVMRRQLSDTTDKEARFALYDTLSSDYFRVGMVTDSMRVREEIVNDTQIGAGRRSLAASSLAVAYALTDNYSRSQHRIVQAKTLARETTPEELETLPDEPSYAYFAAEAEIDRRGLNRHDIALQLRREGVELAWHNLNDPALSEKRHRAAANELLGNYTEVIRLMVQNNRRTEALSYANEMLWDIDHRPDLKPSPTQRANVDFGRAIALASNDDYDGALAAIDAAIAGFRQAGVAPHSGNIADALRIRLMIALAVGRIGDYQADADALEYAASVNPVVARSMSANERDSLILAAHGHWPEAESRIAALMASLLRSQGPESPFYKYPAAMQMLYRLEDPSAQVSEADIAAYVTPIVGTEDEWNDSSTRGAYVEDGALATSMSRAMNEGEQGQVLAFRIAELFHMNATQGAMTDGAARLAASTPGLRALVEQEQALRYEQNTAHVELANLNKKLEQARGPSPFQSKEFLAESDVTHEEKAIEALDGKLASLRQQIVSQFPVYRQLVSPAIPTPAVLGAALHEGEVYVDLYAGRNESYAFVVHPGGAFRAIRLATTRAALSKQVRALRAGFDTGIPPQHPGELAGFDLSAATSLYQALIAPIQDEIRGAKTVYIATSGMLASIPFDVLVMQPASVLSDANWWISSSTPVRIPNASALVFARSHPATHAAEPFIAFADPSFDGREPAADSDVPAVSAAARAFPVDDGASTFDYHRVAPLPETLTEARSIASALGSPEQSVMWGTRASRTEAMKIDLSSDRVVLFATHGIVAGEVPGWHKSGLALAYEGSGLADSILTADDIVTLHLNADWVVLSACNTGLVSGNAGDAVSELSRAFFAAGARSMLVTQWAVESRSAAEVTTGVFSTYAADPSLSKSDALARTERDMAIGKDGALYRHPYFWGAYVLVGDAAR